MWGGKIAICLTRLIWHGFDQLYLAAALPPRRWPPRPMGINRGAYNIRGGCDFSLTQVIRAIERVKYNLMLLMETNISDVVYCHKRLWYVVV